MRRLIHLSDLHFGRAQPQLTQRLQEEISHLRPDLVVISGDLTHKATRSQFHQAQLFLTRLPFRKLIVPGHHDIPLWHRLLWSPLSRYQEYITQNLSPSYEDEEISVQGVTAADGRMIGGRIENQVLSQIIAHWQSLPPHIFRILVSHNPFENLMMQKRKTWSVGNSALQPSLDLPLYADLILSGHSLRKDSLPTEQVFLTPERSIVAIQSGTRRSDRLLDEANSYNELILDQGEVTFEKRTWREETGSYQMEKAKRFFHHSPIRWSTSSTAEKLSQ